MSKKILFLLVFFLLVGGAFGFLFYFRSGTQNEKKEPVPSSQTDQISQENGDSSTSTLPDASNTEKNEPLPIEEKKNEITVSSIQENQEISSPVVVEGEARGSWFFEGQFPVYVMDQDKKIIGNGSAQAKGNWMTEEFVPFIATVDFNSSSVTGWVILEKNNPSGLSQNRMSVHIPVRLTQKPVSREAGGCHVTGCSGQVCSDQDVPTDCMYKEEYICYQKAKCERQITGQCGWTQTKELTLCLDQFVQENE